MYTLETWWKYANLPYRFTTEMWLYPVLFGLISYLYHIPALIICYLFWICLVTTLVTPYEFWRSDENKKDILTKIGNNK